MRKCLLKTSRFRLVFKLWQKVWFFFSVQCIYNTVHCKVCSPKETGQIKTPISLLKALHIYPEAASSRLGKALINNSVLETNLENEKRIIFLYSITFYINMQIYNTGILIYLRACWSETLFCVLNRPTWCVQNTNRLFLLIYQNEFTQPRRWY